MVKIYICEDVKDQREKIKIFAKDAIASHSLNMEIEMISANPLEILEKAKENSSYQSLYFLDVDLKATINGIALAAKIREFDPNGFIVFITTHAEMSYLTFTYKVAAMDYIIKDNYDSIKNKICDCMLVAKERCSSNKNDSEEIFSIKKEDRIIKVPHKDILFFETSSVHRITLHLVNRQIEFYGKMKEIEESLDKRFLRVHRSTLVNKDNISEVDKKNKVIIMVNGQECYCSNKSLKELI